MGVILAIVVSDGRKEDQNLEAYVRFEKIASRNVTWYYQKEDGEDSWASCYSGAELGRYFPLLVWPDSLIYKGFGKSL